MSDEAKLLSDTELRNLLEVARCCGLKALEVHIRALSLELASMRQQLAAGEAALRNYGQHRDNCLVHENGLMGDACTCGFSAAMQPEPRHE